MNTSQHDRDEHFMRKAIALGEKSRLISPPNPWVGCVIVQNDQIIGEGSTKPAGDSHAEVVAIQSAKNTTQDATAYVTLEPCSHHGKTPPCVNALIKAKIARVVVAVQDPDPQVNGTGIKLLRKAGIEVSTGVCEKEASQSLAPYIHQRKTKRPFCLLKTAMSIDGRTAAADGSSQWISSMEARIDAHQLRAESQAIVIGSGTALADNPFLTVRHIHPLPIRPPLRIILDSTGRVRPPMNIFDTEQAPTLMIGSARTPIETIELWKKSGADTAILPLNQSGQGIDFSAFLDFLGNKGIIQILVEGGASLNGEIIREALFQRLIIYVGETILGDRGIPVFKNIFIANMKEAMRLRLLETKTLGNSVRLEFASLIE